MSAGASFHQRHRRLLTELTVGSGPDLLLDQVAEREGWPANLTWHREWARLASSTRPRVELLYQAEEHPALLCGLEIGGAETADHDLMGSRKFGPVAVTVFPRDRKLDTLAKVMADHDGAIVVRYRPGKRCTIRATQSKAGAGPTSPFYLKVFGDQRGSRLHTEGQELWAAARSGALGFEVAEPLSYDPVQRTYAQAVVSGVPVISDLYSPDGPNLAHRLGLAAATIPTSGLAVADRHGIGEELARTRRRASEVVAFIPGLAEPVAAFLAAVERAAARLDGRPPRPIHGSPHPNQWLADGSVLGLVDFDRLCLGDPELDVATFTAEVDFEVTPGRDQIVAAFEDGYRERYGPLDPDRLGLYRATKRFAKVHRTARAVRVDGDRRAEIHLRAADLALRAVNR